MADSEWPTYKYRSKAPCLKGTLAYPPWKTPLSGTTGNLRPADRGREDTREMNFTYWFRIPKGGPWAHSEWPIRPGNNAFCLREGPNYIIRRVWRSASMEGEVPAKVCFIEKGIWYGALLENFPPPTLSSIWLLTGSRIPQKIEEAGKIFFLFIRGKLVVSWWKQYWPIRKGMDQRR